MSESEEIIQVDETKNEENVELKLEENDNIAIAEEVVNENPENVDNEKKEQDENNIEDSQIFEESNIIEPEISTHKVSLSAQDELINYFNENFEQINTQIAQSLFMTWLEKNQEG